MPLFDEMYYDQKWSVWDTFSSFGRNMKGYVITAAYRMGNLITAQHRRGNTITTQHRRGEVIKGG